MKLSNKEKVRNDVIALSRAEPVFLDTETTGLDPDDEVVDIAIVAFDGTILVDSLIKPNKHIPADASAIHGITDEMIKNAPSWEKAWPKIEQVLSGKHVAIYNAEFDIRLIRQSSQLNNIIWRPPYKNTSDVMHLFADYFGSWDDYHQSFTWQKLEAAGRYFNINLPNSHRALADTLVSREVFLRMGEEI